MIKSAFPIVFRRSGYPGYFCPFVFRASGFSLKFKLLTALQEVFRLLPKEQLTDLGT